MPAPPGTRLGPYEIVALLGSGGMGEVHKATDTRLGRTVAIKLLYSAHTDRFEREARAIAALNHPHICTLYDVGPDYLVMEYIEGTRSKGLCHRKRPCAWRWKSLALFRPRIPLGSCTAILSLPTYYSRVQA